MGKEVDGGASLVEGEMSLKGTLKGTGAFFLKKTVFVFAVFACVLVIAACAPRLATESDTQESNSDEEIFANLPTWTIDSGCSGCHTSEAASTTDALALCSIHTPEGLICTDCHADANSLATVHVDYATAKQPVKLNKTTVSSDTCTTAACHDVDDLASKTSSETVLTDLNGTTVNPHDLPISDIHVSKITCASCHKMHATELVSETAPKSCTSCHHAGVYECGSCHPV